MLAAVADMSGTVKMQSSCYWGQRSGNPFPSPSHFLPIEDAVWVGEDGGD